MFLKLAAPGAEDSPESYADTDAGGHYSAHLAAGNYRIWVDRAGFSRLNYGAFSSLGAGKVLKLGPGQELHDLSFRISPLGAISGHVLDEDGDPIQGAGIQVLKFSYETGRRMLLPVSGTSSNDRGEYRAFGLPPGRYFLLVTRPGGPLSTAAQTGLLIPDTKDFYASMYYPGVLELGSAAPIVLAEGADIQDSDIRLRRIRAVTVRGRLLSPVGNFTDNQVQIALAPRDGGAGSSVNRATPAIDRTSGRFEFHNVAPGSYVLEASQFYRGHTLSGRLPIEITNADHPEEISMAVTAGSEITGTVELDAAAPDALKGTRVLLADSEGLATGPAPMAQVEAGGAFRLSGVPAGVWDISLSPLPKGTWIKTILFDARELPGGVLELADSARGALRIVLSSGGAQLSGTVKRDGQPSRATVVLAPAAAELGGSAANYPSVSADDQGNFAFSGIRPGSYKLLAFDEVEPYAWLDPDFLKSVDSQGQEIALGEGDDVKCQLTVVGMDSSPVAP